MKLFGLYIFMVAAFPARVGEPAIDGFMKNPTIDGYFALEQTLKQRMNIMKTDQLVKSGPTSLFLNTVKVYYTHLLPKKFPGRRIHLSCFGELYHLRDSFRKRAKIKEKFQSYKNCLLYQFRENLPGDFERALSALEKIK